MPNVDHLPGHLTVPSFGPCMVCTKWADHRGRRAAELAGGHFANAAQLTGAPHSLHHAADLPRLPYPAACRGRHAALVELHGDAVP
jgi:hypothetical protein